MVVNDRGNTGVTPTAAPDGKNGNTFTIGAHDGKSALITTRTLTFVVSPTNDAPVVNEPGARETLPAVDEDFTGEAAPAGGQTVSDLFGKYFDDSRDGISGRQPAGGEGGSASDTFWGVAIVGNAATADQGEWQYHNGTAWVAISTAASDGSAPGITVGEDATDPAGHTVQALFLANFNDETDTVPGGSSADGFAGVAIVGTNSADGVWQYNDGTGWKDLPGDIGEGKAFVLKPTDSLRFLPDTDYNGTPDAAVTVRLIDASEGPVDSSVRPDLSGANAGGTTPYSAEVVVLTVAVMPENDRPVFTVDGKTGGIEVQAAEEEDKTGEATSIDVPLLSNVAVSDIDLGTTPGLDAAVFGAGRITVGLNGFISGDALRLDAVVSGTIVLTADNDPPRAEDDANTLTNQQHTVTGNLIRGDHVNGGGSASSNTPDSDPDTPAGELRVTGIRDLPDAGTPPFAPVDDAPVQIEGKYGTLILEPDGSYTYALYRDHPEVYGLAVGATLTESFEYELSDGDTAKEGTDTATLTITITGGEPQAGSIVPEDHNGSGDTNGHNAVSEKGLRPGASDESHIVSGSIAVSADSGIASVTIGGRSIPLDELKGASTGTPLTIEMDHGTLEIVGFTPKAGEDGDAPRGEASNTVTPCVRGWIISSPLMMRPGSMRSVLACRVGSVPPAWVH